MRSVKYVIIRESLYLHTNLMFIVWNITEKYISKMEQNISNSLLNQVEPCPSWGNLLCSYDIPLIIWKSINYQSNHPR